MEAMEDEARRWDQDLLGVDVGFKCGDVFFLATGLSDPWPRSVNSRCSLGLAALPSRGPMVAGAEADGSETGDIVS